MRLILVLASIAMLAYGLWPYSALPAVLVLYWIGKALIAGAQGSGMVAGR